MSARLVVVEVNEVSPRVFRWYADRAPRSTIARLVRNGLVETENHDVDERGLYPAQTWATLATGVPFEQHGVYWYADPKPARFPLYWQLAAEAGARVGIVGTLHSSPLAEQASNPNIVFALPDCFASDDAARPERYRRFQRLNVTLTRESGRVATTRVGLKDAFVLASTPSLGVRLRSISQLGSIAMGVLLRRTSRERVRSGQFILTADMFEHLARKHDPDLAVLFTNHVASVMHRYWYATFPDDFDRPLYDEAWVARYREEIPFALDLLDDRLSRLVRWCDETGRGLVVVTSMGQIATRQLDDEGERETAIVRDARRFVATLVDDVVDVRPGMVPQIGVVCRDEAHAADVAASLRGRDLRGLWLDVDVAGNVLTITYRLDASARAFSVDGRDWTFADAGVAVEAIDDHRSGDHTPIGSLLVHGIDVSAPGGRVDVLDVAPALLRALGVPAAPHHRWPSLALGTTEKAYA